MARIALSELNFLTGIQLLLPPSHLLNDNLAMMYV